MSISQFIVLMQSLGLTDREITYLLDLENIRQANGLYPDLDTLASLIGRFVRPLPPPYEIHAIDGDSTGSLIADTSYPATR